MTQPQTKKQARRREMIFLLGWLCLPVFAVALGELQAPWFQIGSVAMLAFIAVSIAAMVRVVRRF